LGNRTLAATGLNWTANSPGERSSTGFSFRDATVCTEIAGCCRLLSHRRHTGGVAAVAWGSAAGREVIVSGNYDSTARVWRSAGIDVITLDVLAKLQSLGMRHRICAPLQGPHFAYSQYQHDASGRSAKTRMSGCHRPGTCGLLELGCWCRRGCHRPGTCGLLELGCWCRRGRSRL
jgi:hypothetical protein